MKKKLDEKKIKTNMFITTSVILVIEVLFVTLIILPKKPQMIWCPILFLGIYVFAMVMDYEKLKEVSNDSHNS